MSVGRTQIVSIDGLHVELRESGVDNVYNYFKILEYSIIYIVY